MNFKAALPNFKGKLLAHWMPWTGNPLRVSHDTGYKQNDLAVIKAQVDCMKASGIDGVIACWQGPNSSFTHDAFVKMFFTCLDQEMSFMVLLDQWIAKNQPNPTQSVITALQSQLFQEMLPFFVEKWVLEFDLGLPGVGVNILQVQQAVPNITLLSKHTGFSWPETTNSLPALARDNANPTMKVPGIFSRFDDSGYPLPNGVTDPIHFVGQRDYSRGVWGAVPPRIVEARAGKTFLDSCMALPGAAQYAGLVTWNDYDEGTEHEPEASRMTGIRIGV